MEKRLFISKKEEYFDIPCTFNFKENDYNSHSISVTFDGQDSFGELLSQLDTEKVLEDAIEEYETLSKYKSIAKIKEVFKGKTIADLIKETECVIYHYEEKEIENLIKNEPDLRTKSIIVFLPENVTIDDINHIEEVFGSKNVYVRYSQDYEETPIEDYKKSIMVLDKIVEDANSYDFSPFEKVMYVYDIVRQKIYKTEEEGQGRSASNDIASVILGDKIVCAGYSNILNNILNKLGIVSNIYNYNGVNGQDGHARVVAHIKDDIYNIDGVYFLDATWDSKKDENDTSYLYSYKFFAKIKEEIDCYLPDSLEDKNIEKDFYYLPELITDQWRINPGLIPPKYIASINKMAKYYQGSFIIDLASIFLPMAKKVNVDELYSVLEEIRDAYFKPIYADTYIKALFNVRKALYYSNPSLYPFDLKSFYITALKSKWSFEKSATDRLLESMLEKRIIIFSEKRFKEFIERENIDKKIEEAIQTRTLKKPNKKKK